jgi:hypothetical protein
MWAEVTLEISPVHAPTLLDVDAAPYVPLARYRIGDRIDALRQALRPAGWVIVLGPFGVVTLGCGLVVWEGSAQAGINPAVAFLLGAGFLAFGGFLLRWAWVLLGDVVSRHAAAEEGIVTVESRWSAESLAYFYVVNGWHFQVGYRGFRALIPGLPYRLYYAKRSGRFASIEPVPAVSTPAPATPR